MQNTITEQSTGMSTAGPVRYIIQQIQIYEYKYKFKTHLLDILLASQLSVLSVLPGM